MVKQKNYPEVMTMMGVTVMMTLMSCSLVTGESLMGGHLDNQETTLPDTADSSLHYRIVNVVPFAFNGGQPFSLEKDPVTGQIDFDKAPPLKALNYTGSYEANSDDQEEQMGNEESEIGEGKKDDDNDTLGMLGSSDDETNDDDQQIPNEINPYSPSFHDFLNLPVRYSNHEKYTSDKYPLISSSYANTKVQGGSTAYNAYTINHKNYHHAGGKASTSQSYSMTRRPYIPRSTTTRKPTTTTTSTTTSTTTTTTTTTTEPPTTTTSTTPSTTTTKKPTTTEPVTTWKPPPPPKIDRYDIDYEEEAMLPIEKMQSTPGMQDQVFGSLDTNAYEDSYEDYAPLDSISSTVSSTSPSTTIVTTQSPPQTSMPLDPVRINSDSNMGVNRPLQGGLNVNVGVGGYSSHPMNHPGYSGLVVESSSNVIVPPDQDTISFVLGNRQNVQGSFYAHGSAIPESPYSNVAHVPVRTLETGQQSLDLSIGRPSIDNIPPPFSNQLPTETIDHSGQKWWFNSDQSEKSQSVAEKTKDDKINVAAGYRVVFPTTAPDVSISSDVSATTVNPTTMPPLTSTVQDGPSMLSEILTPPAMDGPLRPSPPGQRPPYYPPPPHHHHHQHHPHPYHQARPEAPTRVQRPPLSPSNNGYKIRPPLSLDVSLPNILPQFRPNVKTSQRRGSDAIGTLIVPNPPKYPHRVSMRPPPPPPPSHRVPQRRPAVVSHLQRLNPPPPPPPPVHTLRLPTPAALVAGPDSHGQGTENIPVQKEIPPNRRNVIGGEGQMDERNRLIPNSQILKSRLNDEDVEKLSAESPAIPPRAPLFPKRKSGNSSVATLQMIQHHRMQPDIDGHDGDMQSDGDDREQADRRADEPPVYVVYPVKGSMDIRPDSGDSAEKGPLDESIVIGTHGPQRPLPPETLSQQDDEEAETVVPPRPAVQLAFDFPYPPAIPDPSLYLSQIQEKPLLVPNEHQQHTEDLPFEEKDSPINNQQDRDTSINVIPYLQDHQPFPMKQNIISTTLQLFGGSPASSSSSSSSTAGSTATPIAYVYTPTTRAPLRRHSESFERNPILLPSQQPSSSSSSAPSPQSFMAPFVASISAEAPSKNGWSVVTSGAFVQKSESTDNIDRNDSEKNSEDRMDTHERNTNATTTSDSGEKHEGDEKEASTSTGDFDAENFKPQLFGGFQPIFEFPSDREEMPSDVKHTGTVTMLEKPRVAKESGP